VTPQEVRQEIGARVRQVREISGMSQTELARTLATDQSKWSKYELGHRMPDPIEMIGFCEMLGVTLDYIYRGLTQSKCRNPRTLLK
jgi:transcriptional regulator with XRE-family HTH domain